MIFHFKENLQSTQTHLVSLIKSGHYAHIKHMPIILSARYQHGGIGSRANSWNMVDCGLYMSVAIRKDSLPSDLAPQSSSIYLGYILLKLFRDLYACYDLNLWLKWPNDFYLEDAKVGGIMTNSVGSYLVFGFGLNIFAKEHKSMLDIDMLHAFSREKTLPDSRDIYTTLLHEAIYKILKFFDFHIVESGLKIIDDFMYIDNRDCMIFKENGFSWASILQEYKAEFYKNYGFYAHVSIDNMQKSVSFAHIALADDGGIIIDNKIFYSMR